MRPPFPLSLAAHLGRKLIYLISWAYDLLLYGTSLLTKLHIYDAMVYPAKEAPQTL